MKKRVFFLCSLFLLLFVFVIVSCFHPLNPLDFHPPKQEEPQPNPPGTGSDHVHQWGAWSVTTPATCSARGVETRICALDSLHTETRGIAINPDAHVLGSNSTITKQPTCTEEGIASGTCTLNPAHVLSNSPISALGHDYQNWAQTTAPTCTTAGIETGTCTRDQVTTTRTGAVALGHDYQWAQTTAPTCTTAGVETGTCTRDSSTTTRAVAINPDAHDWNTSYTTISVVTVTTDGIEAITCKHNNLHTKDNIITYATGTPGLAFEAIDSTAYRLRAGTVTTGAVHIPAYHRPNANSEYLPVTEIGASNDLGSNGAFANTSITSVTFAENSQLKIIGNYAFRSCSGLTSITIPSSVTSIGGYAFNWCDNLTSVTILTGVTSIGQQAFDKCTKLASVTIPASVTSIGAYAFMACTSLTGITVDANNPNYSSDGKILYNKAKTILIAYPSASGVITIPSGVTFIYNDAFNGCTSLTSITIPAGVTSIYNNAFRGCTSLTSVTIPASVRYIYDNAFNGCTSLTSITIPAGVTSISTGAFSSCTSLTSITIPAGASIGNYAFYGWTSSQTINIQDKANQAAADAAWGADWRNGCNAVINYTT